MFGEIVEGKMVLNEYGEIVKFTWYDLPNHNPNIKLDEFVLMPNHVHGIIILKDMQNVVGTGSEPVPTQKYHDMPEIVRQFKTFSARRINKSRNTTGQQVWQRSYYDHIIRNENSLENIRLYIRENPLSWETDTNNPENLKY